MPHPRHGSGQVLPARYYLSAPTGSTCPGPGHEIIRLEEVWEEASVQPLSMQIHQAMCYGSCWSSAKSAGGRGPKPAEPKAAGELPISMRMYCTTHGSLNTHLPPALTASFFSWIWLSHLFLAYQHPVGTMFLSVYTGSWSPVIKYQVRNFGIAI